MSKDPSNPFFQLKVRDFPPQRFGGVGEIFRCSNTSVKNKKKEAVDDDADKALFLEAMEGTVQVYGGRGSAEKKEEGKAAFTFEDENVFAKALNGAKFSPKKEVPHSLPMVKRESGVEVSSTLEAKALVGIQRVRSAGEQPPQIATGEEDESLRDFLKAVKGTCPLHSGGRDVPLETEPQTMPPAEQRHPLQDFMEGKVEFSVVSTDEYAEGHVVGLDLSLVGQLRARQFSPEAHIDLHGLNSAQAFHTLVGFFRSAYYKGVRVALIVTGRGRNSPNGAPVLRGRVQEWFMHDPFKRVVLAFCSAKQEDGGTGAFYVLLRRYKKNSGKIRWDIMPSDPDLYL